MKYQIRDGFVVLGQGPLSKTFYSVESPSGDRYLVWASTGRYRLDEEPHHKDLIA